VTLRPFRYGDHPLPTTGIPKDAELWLIDGPPAGDSADILDTAERTRLHSFVRDRDRVRYRSAHLALRFLLGAYLDLDPRTVALTRAPCLTCGGPHGRPVVEPPAGVGRVPYFSLSYAGDLVLFAFAAVPVGVDAEQVPSSATAAAVARLLHPRERAELSALPQHERPAAFARCWARKEACLKATGQGLAEGAAEPYVGCGRHASAPDGWKVHDLAPRPGTAAALASWAGPGAALPGP